MNTATAFSFIVCASLLAAACASDGMTSYVSDTGELVSTATLTRGEDGLVRDRHGNVVREARFVRNTGVVSDNGPPHDIFCTRERRVGTNFSHTLCMTRREIIAARLRAQDELMGIMNPDTAPMPNIGQ